MQACGVEYSMMYDSRHLFDFEKYQIVFRNIAMIRQCNNQQCMRKDRILLKCKRCLKAFYCNRKCQKIDWKQRHKKECTHRSQRRFES